MIKTRAVTIRIFKNPKRPINFDACATCSELPSNISTIPHVHIVIWLQSNIYTIIIIIDRFHECKLQRFLRTLKITFMGPWWWVWCIYKGILDSKTYLIKTRDPVDTKSMEDDHKHGHGDGHGDGHKDRRPIAKNYMCNRGMVLKSFFTYGIVQQI